MIDPGREVTLVAGDTIYTLYAGNRALRLMERETGEGLFAIVERFERIDQIEISLLTTIVWALLCRHHSQLSIDDVDDVIDVAGYEAITDAIGRAIERAFPAASGADETPVGKAQRGTGTKSSPGRLVPASASPSSGR